MMSFIHLHDAAAAAVLALEADGPAIYNVTDDEPAPMRDWLPVLAAALGARPPRRVPEWAGRLIMGSGLDMLMQARGAANAKAKKTRLDPALSDLARGIPHDRGVKGHLRHPSTSPSQSAVITGPTPPVTVVAPSRCSVGPDWALVRQRLPTTVTVYSGTEPGDELDLDGDADGQFGETDRGAGMPPGVAEDLDQQVGAPVQHGGVWSKPGATFTMPKTLMIR